jgi:FkbM family methyltransferase
VVDVGAYIGTHTLAFAKAVGSGGRVIAFEAQPAAFEALGRNVAAHQGGLGEGQSAAIQLEYAVAASEPGQVAIPVLDVDASGSFGSASLVESLKLRVPSGEAAPSLNSGLLMVRAVTIDSLNLESCCLVKLDVEGAEDLVLQGAIETIRRCSPILYCECNSLAQGLRTLDVKTFLARPGRWHW